MLVSRLITRTSGATSSSTRRASPQGQAKPAGRGIRPWARSARRTYARASPAYLSRSSGIARVREHLVHAPASHHVAAQEQGQQPIAHLTHSARPPAAPLNRRPALKAPHILLNTPDNLICARPLGQHQASRNRSTSVPVLSSLGTT